MKKKNIVYILLLILIASSTFNTVFTIINFERPPDQIFNDSIKSIVEVKASTENVGESYGTAEFIKKDGTLITNAHVITYKNLGDTSPFDNIFIKFCFENEFRAVNLINYDLDLDIAILQLAEINIKIKPLKVGDSTKVNNGNKVYAIGNLNNNGLSITDGIISNSNIEIQVNNTIKNVLQCDLTIADGNSGGALLDKNGSLIGITTFRLRDTSGNIIYGISYCVPINIIMEYIEKQ